MLEASFFNTIAGLLSNNYKVIEKALVSELKPSLNDRVLDLACGTGRFSGSFPQIKYTGIDLNSNYIDYARIHHNGSFEIMDARQLKFPDCSFGHIFSIGLFHHLDDAGIPRVLSEVRRVLGSKGTFIVIDAIWPTSRWNMLGYILRKLDKGKFIRYAQEYEDFLKSYFTIRKSYCRKYGSLEFILFSMVKNSS